jgi:hypothetical protein
MTSTTSLSGTTDTPSVVAVSHAADNASPLRSQLTGSSVSPNNSA